MAAERREVQSQTIRVGELHQRLGTLLQRRAVRRASEAPLQLTLNWSSEPPRPAAMKIDRRQFGSDPECARASAPVELEGYAFLDVLGRGACGVVHRATRDTTGDQVALKVINTCRGHEIVSAACREYDVLKQMDHPHIVRVLDLHVLTSHAVLVMELFGGAPLSRVVQRATGKCIAEEEARLLFRALLLALGYLHGRGIVHRDTKPENVLASDDLTDLRLIDFSTACFSKDIAELCAPGTELYAAPEVLCGAAPTEANDVWGAGVCLHLMLSGRLPSICGQAIESPREGGPAELRMSGSRWRNVAEPAKNATRRCLSLQRSRRPSAALMLEDAWVAGKEREPATEITLERPDAELALQKDVALPGSGSLSDADKWSKASTADSRRAGGSALSGSGKPTTSGDGDFLNNLVALMLEDDSVGGGVGRRAMELTSEAARRGKASDDLHHVGSGSSGPGTPTTAGGGDFVDDLAALVLDGSALGVEGKPAAELALEKASTAESRRAGGSELSGSGTPPTAGGDDSAGERAFALTC